MTTRAKSRFKRCPKCTAMLRRTAELCPHCSTGMPISFPYNPLVAADTQHRIQLLNQEVAAPTAADVVSRYLIIVARERRDLYEYLRRVFVREPGIEVVLERRTAERRTASGVRPLDRRRRERRNRSQMDVEMRRFGFGVARLD